MSPAAASYMLLSPEQLTSRLQELGVVNAEQMKQAKEELGKSQERFSVILAQQGVLRDPDIGKRIAAQLGVVSQRLEIEPNPGSASAQVAPALWRLHRLAPLKESDGRLLAATDDPFSALALDLFQRLCGCAVDAVLVSEEDLKGFLSALEGVKPPTPQQPTPKAVSKTETPKEAEKAPAKVVEAASVKSAAKAAVVGGATATDEPIIRLVDSILSEAVRMRASDIHIEPSRNCLRVRYRVDGVLHDVNNPPSALQGPVVSRIKILSGLNIAEKRLPQDGRLQMEVEGKPLDVRISTLPSMHGESVVMRLLDRSQPIRGLEGMGLAPESGKRWDALIRSPHGMVLVTGPTGSGKTTTLYGALSVLNKIERKLITVEDPVEYQLHGVNQVTVRPSIGLSFAAGLRSILRQAPDVIMIGEIRDQETAQIAVQAALTGHLVLSTLHTNDAPSSVTRLIDMGIAPFLVASTLQGVLAQRLVRRICVDCRMTDNITPEEKQFLGEPEVAQVIRGNGCDKCHDSGYFGRLGLFELLIMTDKLRELVVRRVSAAELRKEARKTNTSGLREDGINKVREGLTTVSEVLRVVSSI